MLRLIASLLMVTLAFLAVVVVGTGFAIQQFDSECKASGGTHTMETWHGIPVESTCSF